MLISVLAMGMYSCKEDIIGQYPVEFTPPGVVSDVTYDTLPGAVLLSYKLPIDKDLMYVKATYTLDNGTKMEAAASAFTNKLLIDGFGKGDSVRTVTLVAVDLNQNVSAPIEVKVVPKESPIYDVFRSIKAGVDFGGIYLKWKNPLKAKVIVIATTPDAAGKPVVTLGGKFYSFADSATVNVRGYDTIPRNFYIQIADRWGNKTAIDTLKEVKPLYEIEIPKINFRKWNPTDIPYQEYNGSFGISVTWDGKWGALFGNQCYSTASGGNTTSSVTYDLNYLAQTTGKGLVIPSRMKIYARSGYGFSAIPKNIRVWGSTSASVLTTNTEGPDAWVLLSPPEGFLIAPLSGASGLTPTAADKKAIEEDGIDLIFGPGKQPIRYVRIESVSMWNTAASIKSFTYAEITWFGKVQ